MSWGAVQMLKEHWTAFQLETNAGISEGTHVIFNTSLYLG